MHYICIYIYIYYIFSREVQRISVDLVEERNV